eukprot:TRINITY_DN9432_c0_g1_i1.p1 TRINITY_DN9432_c0_g1~~TRINITY_DN9432_c0_g1_i1.p1  ORF type:complete len:256 (+),score=50.33 TRINITY_DN9432_c0_g1_i1:170-937(+)
MLSAPQFTNRSSLSKNYTNISEHDILVITATVFLLGDWPVDSALMLGIDGKEVWASSEVAPPKRKTSRGQRRNVERGGGARRVRGKKRTICNSGDRKIKLRVKIEHSGDSFNIQFTDNTTSEDNGLTWGLNGLKIEAFKEGFKKPVFRRAYFGREEFESIPAVNWLVNMENPQRDGKCGDVKLFGGPGVFSGVVAKRYLIGLPPHKYVEITGDFYLIDKWTDERISVNWGHHKVCLLYTSPSPRDGLLSRMPSSA